MLAVTETDQNRQCFRTAKREYRRSPGLVYILYSQLTRKQPWVIILDLRSREPTWLHSDTGDVPVLPMQLLRHWVSTTRRSLSTNNNYYEQEFSL